MKQTSAHFELIGPRRHRYLDWFYLNEGLGLYMVADSSGSVSQDGTLSSQLAIETIANYLQQKTEEAPVWPFQLNKGKNFHTTQLRVAMKLANHVVHQKGQEEGDIFDMQGFGASLVALWCTEDAAVIAHAGDCRAYRIRENQIEALTEDHTLLNDYIKMGKLTPEEIRDFPHKNVLIRDVGSGKELIVDLVRDTTQPGDLYLLCTDGLHDNVSDKEMLRIMSKAKSLPAACESLVASATQSAECDNCTVVLVRVSA